MQRPGPDESETSSRQEEEGVAASVARNGLKALAGVVIVAALAMTSTAKAGLIGTGPASYCDPTAAQAFSPRRLLVLRVPLQRRLRGREHRLGPERRRAGGLRQRAVLRRDDSHSLLLPEGSSAYSGTVCFALGDWHLRLFAKNAGSRTGVTACSGRRPEPPRRPAHRARRRNRQGRLLLGALAPARAPARQRHEPGQHRGDAAFRFTPVGGAAPPSRSTMSIWIPGSAP